MYCMPLRDLSEVYRVGISIEDRWAEEKKANARSGPGNSRSGVGYSGTKQGGSFGSSNTKTGGNQSVNFMRNATERRFSNFSLPLSKVLERCIKRGLLQPLEPRPLSNPLPARFNSRAYCNFHQSKGHDTNNCKRLRHEIQDLIDQGKIPDPEQSQPSTRKNPLPNFSPDGVYVIGEYKTEEEILFEMEQEEIQAGERMITDVKKSSGDCDGSPGYSSREVFVMGFWGSDSDEETEIWTEEQEDEDRA